MRLFGNRGNNRRSQSGRQPNGNSGRLKGDKVVGYAFCQGGGHTAHVGITNNPARRRQEHIRNTGQNGCLKVVTKPMTRQKGLAWEQNQSRTRGYYRKPPSGRPKRSR